MPLYTTKSVWNSATAIFFSHNLTPLHYPQPPNTNFVTDWPDFPTNNTASSTPSVEIWFPKWRAFHTLYTVVIGQCQLWGNSLVSLISNSGHVCVVKSMYLQDMKTVGFLHTWYEVTFTVVRFSIHEKRGGCNENWGFVWKLKWSCFNPGDGERFFVFWVKYRKLPKRPFLFIYFCGICCIWF